MNDIAYPDQTVRSRQAALKRVVTGVIHVGGEANIRAGCGRINKAGDEGRHDGNAVEWHKQRRLTYAEPWRIKGLD